MIGRRHIRCNNSWLHNSNRLIKGKNRCNLMMSSTDAQRLQLVDGQAVTVTSATGQVELPLWICDDIMPGVVSMPHGWGHDREGSELAIAAQKAGVSMNDVTDEQVVDELTGMAIINGVPVKVAATVSTTPGNTKQTGNSKAVATA
jgi:anaerobic selenocysteine-containing dehydrogenase